MTTLRPVPDLLGYRVQLLFVGINPGIVSGQTGLHFARRGNRFFPALAAAGVIGPDEIDPALGSAALVRAGVGITNLAVRPTAAADELTHEELREAPLRIERIVLEHRPRVVAFAAITSYRIAFSEPKARRGRQPFDLAGAERWIVPNPSGLNAHETVATLALAYAEVADRASIARRPVS